MIYCCTTLRRLPLIVLVMLSATSVADDLPLLHPLFSDHMVLQREEPIPVWGWATASSQITVSIDGQTQTAFAGADGRWQVTFEPLSAGGPHQLLVRHEQQSVSCRDVLVGDVWLCSGQSNMQWSVSKSQNGAEEIAAADHSQIRLFSVARRTAETPQVTLTADWQVCSPQTISSFSAVAYFFGRDLHGKLEVPIGLIHSSWGGTIAEAWTSREALAQMEDFQQALQDVPRRETVDQGADRWWRKTNSPRLTGHWRQVGFDDSAWPSMEIPQNWEDVSGPLTDFNGVVRFRHSFDWTSNKPVKAARLELGTIDDVDTTWVNGHQVGSDWHWNRPRSYAVPGKYLRAGQNVIAIRVLDFSGKGGIDGPPATMQLRAGGDEGQRIPLAGSWKYEIGKSLQELPAAPRQALSESGGPNVVTVLYNGMIAPLQPYGIRGAIWYQGESNAGRAAQYRRLLPIMIADWRARFAQGDFPFLIVQLANFRARQTEPVEPGWADIRESQQLVAADDPQVGLVITTDLGEANDIHPRNKQDVGKRLARSALAIAYGRSLVHAGPTYRDHVVEGNTIRVRFNHVGEGLAMAGDDLRLQGFAIAGEDGRFVWAEAVRDGDDVIVSSEEIPRPRHVRYNWANNPTGNLFNQAGLPAAPFRTDGPG